MKPILWLTSLVLALAWTAGAWGLSEAVQWAVALPASGAAPALAQSVATWTAPAWLELWLEIDPQELQALRDFALWALGQLQHPAAALQAALPFLVPLVWLAWALGLALLVALTLAMQWALGRLVRLVRRAASARPQRLQPRHRPEEGSVQAS
ncbi:hypothetical protein [Azohydromonas australica]|uniref:hypothetical protein n=1 Tax=Azohydromonas australica TaxID=364039 RepID=UPI00040E7EBF|nr:hypothetical protein [Azohydromonas australica]